MLDVMEVVSSMTAADLASADLPGVREHLARSARVRAWLDAQDIAARRRLEDFRAPFGATPDQETARAGNLSRRDAEQVAARAGVLGEVPQLEPALAAGDVTAAHVDVLERGLKNLEHEDRRRVIADEGARLARLAARQTPDEYAKTVRDTVTAAQHDGGIANFEQQKRATRLKTWTDHTTGMIHLNGLFDPETGLALAGRLRNVVETLFHDKVPDTCPTDPLAKQDHLRALALAAIINDTTGTVAGRPDMIVVIDEQTLRTGVHEHSIIDLGTDTILPVETLRRMACIANIIPVVLGTDGVTRDLGRDARLASRAQRRSMRAMYPSCGLPGCRVPFEQCDLHHIRYWEHGGKSDEDNFLPLCSTHHHCVHEGGWHLQLHPTTRQLTITYPDGSIQTTGPPRARDG